MFGIVGAIISGIALFSFSVADTTHTFSDNSNTPAISSPSSNNNNSNSNSNSNTTVPTTQGSSGEVICEVGTQYATRWFTFTVNNLYTSSNYESITAASGNMLVIANVTLISTYSTPQPYGTFDWHLDDPSGVHIKPLNPVSDTMMPLEYTLEPNETRTYDVVIACPTDLTNPFLTYAEITVNGDVYKTFKIPVL